MRVWLACRGRTPLIHSALKCTITQSTPYCIYYSSSRERHVGSVACAVVLGLKPKLRQVLRGKNNHFPTWLIICIPLEAATDSFSSHKKAVARTPPKVHQ
jgi:hypothetical protein